MAITPPQALVESPANKGRVLGYTCIMEMRAAPSFASSRDELSATFRIVVSYDWSSTRYFLPDHLNSTNVLTDASGTPLQVLDFYPYGSTRINQTTNNFNEGKQFIGQYSDPESNLSYLNARYYEGTRGQFLSQDPTFWGGRQNLSNPQSLNSYSLRTAIRLAKVIRADSGYPNISVLAARTRQK